MNILNDFISDNRRIEILSNGCYPLQIPTSWGKVLGDSDILVAIPDMHMHRHDSQLDSFSAGAAPMFEFLMHLEILKHRLLRLGKTIEVIQIGDYYAQSTQPSAVNEIHGSHWIYGQIARQLRNLSTKRLFGDADFELRNSADSRYTVRTGNVYIEHGFIADYFMPNWTLNHIRESAISELLHRRRQVKNTHVPARVMIHRRGPSSTCAGCLTNQKITVCASASSATVTSHVYTPISAKPNRS